MYIRRYGRIVGFHDFFRVPVAGMVSSSDVLHTGRVLTRESNVFL